MASLPRSSGDPIMSQSHLIRTSLSASRTNPPTTGPITSANAPSPTSNASKSSTSSWKGKFATLFGKGTSNSNNSHPTGAVSPSSRSSATSPVPPQHPHTPTNSYRRENKPESGQKTGISSPKHNAFNMRAISTHSPSGSQPTEMVHFDADLSAGLPFSSPPTESQIEQYLLHLWKLLQTTSLKERNGKAQRRRQIEEMTKLVRSFQLTDLRIVNEHLTALLQPQEDRTLLDEHHAAFDLLCTCLEMQASASAYKPFYYQLLTSHKQQLPARLLGLSLLTKNGRECAPITTYLASTLNDWVGELEGLGSQVLSGSMSHPPVASPSNASSGSTPLPSISTLSSSVTNILQLPPNADSPVMAFLQVACGDAPAIVHRMATQQLLLLILRFVKYHFNSMGESALGGLIARMCSKASHETDFIISSFILPFLDIVVRNGVPMNIRPRVVHALCLCVNISSRDAWTCCRAMLESRDGMEILHSLLESMDEMADDFLSSSGGSTLAAANTNPTALVPIRALRGGVFLVAMSSWASQRVEGLNYPFSTILQHFDHVIDCGHVLLVYEVALACRRLVKKYSAQLRLEWDHLFSIFHKSYPTALAHAKSNLAEVLAESMSVLLDDLLLAGRMIQIPEEEVVELLMRYKPILPTEVVTKLLGHVANLIHPANHNWIALLREVVTVFFLQEKSNTVKLAVVTLLEQTLRSFQHLYGDLLISQVLLSTFLKSGGDGEDVMIRHRKLALLATVLSEVQTSHDREILRLLEASTACEIVSNPDGLATSSFNSPPIVPEVKEIRCFAVSLLVSVFASSFAQAESSVMVATFDVLLKLASHSDLQVRGDVLDALLRIRATEDGCGRLQYELSATPNADKSSDANLLTSAFLMSQTAMIPFSHSLLTCLLRRLKVETNKDIWERCLHGLQSIVGHFFLFDTSHANYTAVLTLACEWCKCLVEERRFGGSSNINTSGGNDTKRHIRLLSSGPSEVFSSHWSAHPVLVRHFWYSVRSILGPSCKFAPVQVEELLSCIMVEMDEWIRSTTSEGTSRPTEILEQMQILLDCCHIVFLSNTTQLQSRFVGHLFDRLVRLSSLPSSVFGGDNHNIPFLLALLQSTHACSTLAFRHSTLDYAQQVLSLALPLLSSTGSPNPSVAYWASRSISTWFITLSLAERQLVLPLIHGAMVNRATKQPWNTAAACLLDFTNRHAFWKVSSKDLHLTQVIPSHQRVHSSLFPSNSVHRSWLHGLNLFSIRVGISDYVEIVVRRSSGTASWIMRCTKHSTIPVPISLPHEHWKAIPADEVGKSIVPTSKAGSQPGLLSPPSVASGLSSPGTPSHGDVSGGPNSKRDSVMSSYSSPMRYIPPSSPTGVPTYHAWPKQLPSSAITAPKTTTQQKDANNSSQPDTVVQPSSYKQRHADALIIASSLVEFKLDASPPSNSTVASPPSPRTTAGQMALMTVEPLLSYDAANSHTADSSPRLYPLATNHATNPGVPLKSASSVDLLSVASASSLASSGHSSPSAAGQSVCRSVGPPADPHQPPVQPVARRSTLPTGVSLTAMMSQGSGGPDTGVSVSPFRSPPRSSADASPLVQSDGSVPSPSPPLSQHSSFSHATSSPFRSAVKVGGVSQTGASPAKKSRKDTVPPIAMASVTSFQRLNSKDASGTPLHSPSSRTRQSSTTTAEQSPIQLPVPIRPRKGPASSNLSLLTQAFSNQKLKQTPNGASTGAPSANGDPSHLNTFASSYLASHGLPLTSETSTVGGVTSGQIEQMWSLIGQLNREQEERKTKADADRQTVTGTINQPSMDLDPSCWQAEFILAHMQENFPDFATPVDASSKSTTTSWQSLSIIDADSVSVALNVLDSSPIRDTLKIGVVYVGVGQATERDILENTRGSHSYQVFLQHLGDSVTLQGEMRYTGGMDREGNRDGEVAILYTDMMHEICYHVATLLPTRSIHTTFQNKLRLLGNDSILIAYVERGGIYSANTLASQSVMVHIIIQPVRSDLFQLSIIYRHPELAATSTAKQTPLQQLISIGSLATYVREVCLVLDLACQSWLYQSRGAQSDSLFGSQEQRCQQIMLLRQRLSHRPILTSNIQAVAVKSATSSKPIPQTQAFK